MNNNHISYDLHIHSNLSDGTFTPIEIINLAKKTSLKGISITDHDVIPDKKIFSYAQNNKIEYIYGIEFSTNITNLHILGYNIDINSKYILNYIAEQKKEREIALQKMCEKTKKYGIPIFFEELKEKIKFSMPGRPHLAELMVEKGYVNNIYEAFKKYLKSNKPIYVDYPKKNFSMIIDIILKRNGFPVLAHPGILPLEKFTSLFPKILKQGLKGLEVFYSRHTVAQTKYFLRIAKEYNLIITGGSDFHGEIKPDIKLGSAGLSEDYFKIFKKRIKIMQ